MPSGETAVSGDTPLAPADATGQEREGGADAATLLDRLPHACFALDQLWRFTYLNPAADHLFGRLSGREPGGLLGRNICDECPELADSTFVRECKQALAEQTPVEAETFYPALNRWFSLHVSPAPAGLCVFLQDVSERTSLERALRARAEQLDEAHRGKDEFVVQLAHEVRNAMAPVRNALHLIQGRFLEDPEDERACTLAGQEVQRLSHLMDNLLKVSQLIPGNMQANKERVNLAEVVARTFTATLSSVGSGGRSLTVELPAEPVWLEADPGQLEQVLTHLLDNAAKFTPPGGHIRLKAERDGGKAVLRVQDDGVGMSPEMLPRVFDLFMRADRGPAQLQGGIGIGLTLVRRLVELHGGEVEARSEGPGKGSEFVVRLPAPEEIPPESPAEEGAGDGPRALRVLVVDDSMEGAQSLALLLGRWGHDVRVTYDGARALEEIAVRPPDVVLLDIGMPGMDGYTVAERLREREEGRKVVLVAVTGYGQDDDRARAREAGFDYHMVKPIDPGDLRDLLVVAGDAVRSR